MEEWIKFIAPLIGIAGLWWKLTTSMATKAELTVVKTDLKAEISEVKSNIADLKADLKAENAELRSDIREIRQLLQECY